MFTFSPVTKTDFEEIFHKMISAFPYEERRDSCDQEKCFDDNRFKYLKLTDNNNTVGFITLWLLDGFVYVEHLAVDKEFRGKGYGSLALELLKKTYNQPIILEVEKPLTPTQKKRVLFYEKAGFKMNDYPYIQPSYHGGEGVPLELMSYPHTITQDQCDKFITETLNSAYKKAE